MPYKSRQTEDLRKGRFSLPGARYFLTWVTAQRAPLLADDHDRQIARECIAAIDASSDGSVLAGTIMPDHVHLLVELGARLTISQVAAKTKAAVTRNCHRMKWQLNFFEHQLRATDSAEDYAFYIFMNPCVAGLCPLHDVWPGWISSNAVRWEFQEKLHSGGLPPPEWIGPAQRFGDGLPAGAD